MPPTPKKSSPAPPGGNRKLLIGVVAAVVIGAALVIGAFALSGGDDDDNGSSGGENVSAFLNGIPQDDDVLGSADAGVTLIQFEDLQCPVCKAYQEEGFPDIVEEYVKPGEVKVRFVGLSFLGEDSRKALQYVLAAGRQGQLFQYSEELYARQGPENSGWVTDELLEDVANDLGLDWDQLVQDADSAEVAEQIRAMAAEAQERQVPGTPWFFVQVGDEEPYEVQVPNFSIESFRPILDDALSG